MHLSVGIPTWGSINCDHFKYLLNNKEKRADNLSVRYIYIYLYTLFFYSIKDVAIFELFFSTVAYLVALAIHTMSNNIYLFHEINRVVISSVYFTKSQRGNKLIYINGYTYYSYRVTGLRERWKCTNHRCGAFLVIISGQVMKFVSSHTHQVSEFVNRGPMWRANLEWNLPFDGHKAQNV